MTVYMLVSLDPKSENQGGRKHFIFIGIALIFLFILLSGCNRQIIDTTYSYNKAIIQLPDGEVVSGAVESWKDYGDGDQLQVKIDGKTYLVHSSNVVLVKE